MLTLPNECLLEIFNNFRTYCGSLLYGSLFSCLLVNRQWCRIIVPILWSKPILYDKRFIQTCLLSLNAEEQALLIPFNIILPNNSTPLFEYTSYISHILISYTHFPDDLSSGIKNWLEKDFPTSINAPINVPIDAIKCSITAMLLRINKRLKYLEVFGIIYNKMMVIENICKNNILTYLSLQSNNLGSDGGKAIAEALRINSSLTSLNLKHNQISYEGGKAIAEALHINTTLTSLDLSYNQLCFEGVKAIAKALYVNTTLKSLNIEYNQLCSESGKAFADALCINTTLTSLNIGSNHLGSEGGKAVAEALYKNTTLTFLNIKFNQLNSEGGKAIAEALYKNTVLNSLNISYNQLGSEGGKAIAKALCTNTTLTSLNIGANQLGSLGETVFAEALRTNTNITSLNVDDDYFFDNDYPYIYPYIYPYFPENTFYIPPSPDMVVYNGPFAYTPVFLNAELNENRRS